MIVKIQYVNKWAKIFPKRVLWVSVGQRAAKFQAVKVGGLKKILLLRQSNQMRAVWVQLLDNRIILKVGRTETSQPFDLGTIQI